MSFGDDTLDPTARQPKRKLRRKGSDHMTDEQIKKIIRERVSAWKTRIWSWPHDSFMEQPWGYAIHEASVRAWNAEGRKTDCAKFLLEWATVENIKAAIAEHGLSDYSHIEAEEPHAHDSR